MILIADSGSTKTNWYYSDKSGSSVFLKTDGINPYFRNTEDIVNELNRVFSPAIKPAIHKLFFYGTGITDDNKSAIIQHALSLIFPNAETKINSDLLAAARATLNKNAGIACILGTGSNSCFYNGKEIKRNIPPLGFILGDEGSGTDIGKRIVADYLKNIMPKALAEKFAAQYSISYPSFLEQTYKAQRPNKFLAQFVPFVKANIEHKYCSNLVENAFQEFTSRNILQYENHFNHSISFIGSVAYYFQAQLKKVLNRNEIKLGKILKDPMEGLITYHEKE